jgi:hypothetical protein
MRKISTVSKEDEDENRKKDELPVDIELLDADDTQIQQAISEGMMDRYDVSV